MGNIVIKNSSPSNSLQASLVASYLREGNCSNAVKLHICETIGSTSDYVMSQRNSSDEYVVCVANHQTNARGRNGRSWQSPSGSNIYMSIGFAFVEMELSTLSGLSLACGVAIAKVIENLGVNPQLKWPNDILVDYKKLAGILIETRIKGADIFAVIGLGLNVDMSAGDAEKIDQPWTDLKRNVSADNAFIERNKLVSMLIVSVVDACKLYQKSGLSVFLKDWPKYDVLHGQNVMVLVNGEEVQASVIGVNKDGSLKVRTSDGVEDLYASDVKIKIKK